MLYVFYGPDSFSRREALVHLKRELNSDGMLETNTTLLNAREATPEEVIAACDTVPFLGTRRLVIVEGALQQADGGGRPRRGRKAATASADDDEGPWAALAEYVDRLPETTVLVLSDGGSSGGGLLESLRGKGQHQRFDLPNERAVPQWIQSRAKTMDLNIDGPAARALAGLVSNDIWLLASEMEKLKTYAGGQQVREADVRSLVHDAKEQKGYLLADAAADGRAALATRLLHELLAQNAPGQVLLATIAGRYRRMAVAREMLDAGASGSSVGERLAMRGFGLERLLEQTARYSMPKIRAALVRIVQADMDIKLGLCEEELSLALLVEDLAAATAVRAA